MFGLGVGEILVILVIALVVFGPDKLPEIARTLGRASAELRRAVDEFKFEMTTATPRQQIQNPPAPPPEVEKPVNLQATEARIEMPANVKPPPASVEASVEASNSPNGQAVTESPSKDQSST